MHPINPLNRVHPMKQCRSRSRGPHAPTVAVGLEPLETRALLAVNVVRGILSVRGTPADDVIEVRRAADDATRIEVVENGTVTLSRPIAGLRQIRIDTGAGDDQAIVSQAQGGISLATVINGGRGHDLLRGGLGTNRIHGGPGRDAFEESGGRDRVTDATRTDRIVRAGSPAAFREYLAAAARSRGRFGTMLAAAGGDVRAVSLPTAGGDITATAAGTGAPAGAAGYSETTTQVAGVDEGDIIENDGRHLYVLSRGELLIIDARDADAPAVVSRTPLEGWPIAEYLHDGRLTVVSSVWDAAAPAGDGFMPLLCARQAGQAQVTVFDVADPAAPELVSSTRIDGTVCESRMIDGRLVLVVRNDLLGGYWGGGPMLRQSALMVGGTAEPLSSMPAILSEPATDASLARMVHRSPVNRMLPTWTTTSHRIGGKTTSGLVSRPQDILFPATGNEANLTSIVTLDTTVDAPRIGGATSVIGGYASLIHLDAGDLYLFSPRWNAVSGDQTDVQRFAIDGGSPRLVSTGSFAGSLLDQFSADAEDGLLRVAVTQTTFSTTVTTGGVDVSGDEGQVVPWFESWTVDRRSAVRILATQGDTLRVVGSVDDIAPGESIQSARFIGDRAYLCTFLQVDPLFTIDLSTPSAPRIVGELKVPGYSRFLLPYGDGHLLGVGRDADPATGRTTGLKVSLFDVRDDAAPREVSSFVIDQPDTGWSWSDAEWDVRALGLFTELGVVALPVEGLRPGPADPADPDAFVPWTAEYGVVILRVDAALGITELGTVSHDSRLLRTARIGDVIYSVADRDLRTVLVGTDHLTPRGAVELQSADQGTTGIVVF